MAWEKFIDGYPFYERVNGDVRRKEQIYWRERHFLEATSGTQTRYDCRHLLTIQQGRTITVQVWVWVPTITDKSL